MTSFQPPHQQPPEVGLQSRQWRGRDSIIARRQYPPIGETTKLVTRQERIDDFIHEGSPPNNQPLQILCEDNGLWENAKTSRRIEATVVGWRALNKTQR
jgi:hypothetical protein